MLVRQMPRQVVGGVTLDKRPDKLRTGQWTNGQTSRGVSYSWTCSSPGHPHIHVLLDCFNWWTVSQLEDAGALGDYVGNFCRGGHPIISRANLGLCDIPQVAAGAVYRVHKCSETHNYQKIHHSQPTQQNPWPAPPPPAKPLQICNCGHC